MMREIRASNLYGQKKEYDNCISYSRKALEINPKLSAAYANLASGYYFQGKFEIADSIMAEAKRRFPESKTFERPYRKGTSK